MDPLAINRFLESLITPQVTGAILIDFSSGLCLGAIGSAREDDAAQLVIASRTACDEEGIGAVMLRGEKVLLKLGEEKPNDEGGRVLVGVWRS